MTKRILIIDIATITLIIVITFVHLSILRIILGLPFLLFFPGYTLMKALFANREGMDGIELAALSVVMSAAVVAFIGFGLNYLSSGVSLEPVLYSVSAFIILMSVIALIRDTASAKVKVPAIKPRESSPGLPGSTFSRFLSISLVILILGSLAALGYSLSNTNNAEKYTEFYILGQSGQAQDYPTAFVMSGSKVTSVKYSDGTESPESSGKVNIGIINHEYQETTYSIKIRIDGEVTDFNYQGKTVNQLAGIVLPQDGKWEQEISFAPKHTGDNQKVELLLFKGDAPTSENSLNLWINVE